MLGPSVCDVRPSTEVGEPINIGSGNVYRNEVDAVINSGKIGAFSFQRNYNSLQGELSSFGYGWRHNFDVRILGSTSSPTLQEGSGGRVPFFFCDSTHFIINYCSPPGVTDSLRFFKGSPSGYSLNKRNGTVIAFTNLSDIPAPPNRIKKITDRNSNEINFVFNSTSGLLDTVREPGGRAYNFVYNANNLIQNLKKQAGTTLATYEYYTGTHANHLKKVTYGDNSWVEYVYDSLATTIHKIKKILTSDSNAYFYDYDSKGRATASYQAENVDRIDVTYERVITTGADGDNLIAKVTNQLGNIDSLVSIPNALATDRLLAKGSISGCATCADDYRYDDHSNLIRKKSPLVVIDRMFYDIRDRLVEGVEDSSGFKRTHAFRYDNFDLIIRDSTGSVIIPSDSLTRIFQYDANGNDTTIIESGLASSGTRYTDISRYAYGSYGQLNKTDGSRTDLADTTRFIYDSTATGDLKEVREYAGSTALITQYTSYDAFGNPLSITGPNSEVTSYEYDQRQRAKKIKRSKGGSVDSTLYQYNFAGDIKQITLPRSNTIKYGYDLAGRLTSIVNGAGDSTIYTYDLMSNRKSERIRKGEALLKTTYYDYDSRSRLIQVCVGDSADTAKFDCTKFGYDEVGNRTVQLSARGDSTYFRYDALNRLDTIIQKHDGGYDSTIYTYDLQDNLTSVKDPSGNFTTYKYSDRGHLIQDSSGASGVSAYTYDPAGNLIKKIPATGEVDSVSYAYDALNRQTQIKLGGTTTYTFDYDASATNNRRGRLWRETGPTATRKFSYDYVGRVARESVTIAGRTYYINYTWDKNGNLTTLRYPNGRTVTYTYDLADRVFKAVGVKQSVVKTYFDSTYYLPFGPDTSMKLGNGIKVRKSFDRRYYTQQITNSVAGKFGRSYQYDHNGNITQLLDLIDSTKSYHTVTYDGVDRLTQAYGQYRTDSLFFTYQKNGNRVTKRKGGQILTTYNYTNNRLTSTTGAEAVTYQYNANGSDTSDGTPRYDYDKLNRIVRIRGLTPTDSFAYDGENRRVYSNDSGLQFVNLYDIYGNLLSQYTPGSALYKTDFVWANGEPRMKIDTLEIGLGPLAPPSNPETQFWYHTDHLGTPYVSTDSFKTVRWKISLDPFGERLAEQNPSTNNLRFPGQYFDRGSGLDYNWHRYYQPKIGRYYQVDPELPFNAVDNEFDESPQISFTGSVYSYARSSPLNITDPNGRRVRLNPTGRLYNPVNPRPELVSKLECVNRLIGLDKDIIITDGKRTFAQHVMVILDAIKRGEPIPPTWTSHYNGDAVDVGLSKSYDAAFTEQKLLCAVKKCGFPASTRKYSGNHYHFDLFKDQVRHNVLDHIDEKTCECK